jgi:hypothetical protein
VFGHEVDIKTGAAQLKADQAARAEAKLVVDRWNRRLATGRGSTPAPAAARSIMRAKPAVVNGEPRSLTKTKGEDALSRCS